MERKDRDRPTDQLIKELHLREARWHHSDFPAWEDHRRIQEIQVELAHRAPPVEDTDWMAEYKRRRNETRAEVRKDMKRILRG